MNKTDELEQFKENLVHLARLALAEQTEDVRLYVARMVRKYRLTNPELAKQFETFLKSKNVRHGSPFRRADRTLSSAEEASIPVDGDSRLDLLKVYADSGKESEPLLASACRDQLHQLVQERLGADRLRRQGLTPSKSAIFVGPPGVGKTLSARWIANRLGVPLLVLDLASVMSSFLGKTGNNLKTAIEYAKRTNAVLLLDEIDAIAKRRGDETDIGELKRLVTVILQEVDDWPDTSLLLAATNHPDLVDPALWRRFDLIVKFTLPDRDSIGHAVKCFFGNDYSRFARWTEVLTICFEGESFSHIEKTVQRFRRAVALGLSTGEALITDFVTARALALEHRPRIDLALDLTKLTKLSQRRISEVTGVSRDTIRSHVAV